MAIISLATVFSLGLVPLSPVAAPAEAVRILDSALLANTTLKSFEFTFPATGSSQNTTLYLPLNASATVGFASLNVSGSFEGQFVNLSGWGIQSSDGEQYGQGIDGADYNGDGFGDLAVGTQGPTGAFATEGRVEVFYGSSQQILSGKPNWTFSPSTTYAGFGVAITHGDYDRDGIQDLVVGEADLVAFGVAETVYVFYGSVAGLPSAPSLNLTMNAAAQTAFGRALTGHLDVNGDSYDDLVVGEPEYNGQVGRVDVLWGGPGGLNVSNASFLASASSTQFGDTLKTLGDTDGDGVDEFAVGTPQNNTASGAAAVYEGVANSTSLVLRWSFSVAVQEFVGYSIAGGMDITGDAFPDLAVGAPLRANRAGGVYIFNGTGNATYAATPRTILGPMTDPQEHVGTGVDMLVNLDGDALTDLVIGANRFNNFDGRFYLYMGENLSAPAATWVNSNGTGLQEEFGWLTYGVGDLNGDGLDEFTVTARAGFNGTWQPGHVRLYYGSTHAFPEDVSVYVNTTRVWTKPGPLQGNASIQGFGPTIQAYLSAHQADVNASGFVLVPLAFNFSAGGRLNISNISIIYSVVLPPIGVSTTTPAVGGSVVISWTLHASDATVYSVWSNKSGSWQIIANVSVPRTFYNDTNVTDGVEYFYRLTESDPLVQLQSAPSVTVSATPRDLQPPTTPLNLTIAVNTTGHSATINWTQNVDDTASYEIWRRDDNAAPFVWHATVSKPGSAYTDAGLLEEVDYSYQVRAIDDGGIPSPFGATLSARIPDLTPPLPPVNLAGVSEASGTAVTLTWDLNAADTVGYAVFRSSTGLPGSFAELLQVTGGTASVTGLTRDTTSYFHVVAIDKVGLRSPPSATVSVLTVDTEPPLAPVLQDVSAPAVGNTLIANWTASGDDLAGFRVYTNASGAWVLAVQMGATARSAVVTNLTDGVAAFVRVSAFDTLDHEGPFSAALSATPADTQRPGPPPSTSVTSPPAGSALTVTWTAPSDPDVATYRVYFLDPAVSADFVFAGSVDASVLNFTKSPVTNGGTLRFRVAAVDEAGNEGPFGPDAVGIARDTLAPTAPSLSPSPAATNIVNFAITGTAEPNIRVELWVRGAMQAAVTADATGHFTAEARLIRGDNEVYARAVDTSPVIDPSYKFSANSAALHITLDPDRPTVASAVPAIDATGVAVTANVVIVVSESLAPSSIQLTLRDADGNEVAGHVTYSEAAHSVTFDPDEPLKAGTVYRAQLAATDLAGNALGAYTDSFTTASSGSTGGGGAPAPGLVAAMAALGAAAALAALRGGQRRRR